MLGRGVSLGLPGFRQFCTCMCAPSQWSWWRCDPSGLLHFGLPQSSTACPHTLPACWHWWFSEMIWLGSTLTKISGYLSATLVARAPHFQIGFSSCEKNPLASYLTESCYPKDLTSCQPEHHVTGRPPLLSQHPCLESAWRQRWDWLPCCYLLWK